MKKMTDQTVQDRTIYFELPPNSTPEEAAAHKAGDRDDYPDHGYKFEDVVGKTFVNLHTGNTETVIVKKRGESEFDHLFVEHAKYAGLPLGMWLAPRYIVEHYVLLVDPSPELVWKWMIHRQVEAEKELKRAKDSYPKNLGAGYHRDVVNWRTEVCRKNMRRITDYAEQHNFDINDVIDAVAMTTSDHQLSMF